MKNKTVVSSTLYLLVLLVSGCGSSPDSKFYTLNALPREASSPGTVQGNASVLVKVGPVTIPDTLDQSQIVTRSGPNELDLNEFNRWGGDLQTDFQRILGENISILLPTDHVVLYQEIILSPVDFQVIVNVREFEGQLGGAVTLNADWSVIKLGKEKSVAVRKSVLHENTDSSDFPGYVAAQSRLLAKLSRQISDEIRKQMNQ